MGCLPSWRRYVGLVRRYWHRPAAVSYLLDYAPARLMTEHHPDAAGNRPCVIEIRYP